MTTTFDRVTVTSGDGTHDITEWANSHAGGHSFRPDCRDFAAAWLNVALASGENAEQTGLYRTVRLEAYTGDRLRLTATDGAILLTTTVQPLTSEEPELDEAPLAAWTVMDPDRRGEALLKWAHRLCVRADKNDEIGPSLRLDSGAADPDGPPTLSSELTRRALTITLDETESVTLDIYDAPYPDWRSLLIGANPASVDAVAYNVDYIARLGKLRDVGHYMQLTPSGPLGLTSLRVGASGLGLAHVDGGIMPMRIPDEAA